MVVNILNNWDNTVTDSGVWIPPSCSGARSKWIQGNDKGTSISPQESPKVLSPSSINSKVKSPNLYLNITEIRYGWDSRYHSPETNSSPVRNLWNPTNCMFSKYSGGERHRTDIPILKERERKEGRHEWWVQGPQKDQSPMGKIALDPKTWIDPLWLRLCSPGVLELTSCLPDVPGGGPAPKDLDNPSLAWPQGKDGHFAMHCWERRDRNHGQTDFRSVKKGIIDRTAQENKFSLTKGAPDKTVRLDNS